MTGASDYLLLSLPASCGAKNDIDSWLETTVNNGKAEVYSVKFPRFKVGTLDSLVLQSEELMKLDNQLYGSVAKVLETINSLTNGSVSSKNLKIDGSLSFNKYFEQFEWKQSRFRLEKSIEDLIKLISNEGLQLDADLRSQFQNYNNAKSNLLTCQRKQNGDLSVKSLHDVVSKDDFVLDSEHLKTVLLAVPNSLEESFLNSYETISEFIVPRSAKKISKDNEFSLYGVTLFRKFELGFLKKAREQKWIPREFEYSDEIINKLKNEFNLALKEEQSLKNDLIRLSKESFSEISICWLHIKFLKIFVESVLRYGLPPDFYCFVLKINERDIPSSKETLYERFGYLGGNAFAKDHKGKIIRDTSLHEYANLVDTDYEPFVLNEVHIF